MRFNVGDVIIVPMATDDFPMFSGGGYRGGDFFNEVECVVKVAFDNKFGFVYRNLDFTIYYEDASVQPKYFPRLKAAAKPSAKLEVIYEEVQSCPVYEGLHSTQIQKAMENARKKAHMLREWPYEHILGMRTELQKSDANHAYWRIYFFFEKDPNPPHPKCI